MILPIILVPCLSRACTERRVALGGVSGAGEYRVLADPGKGIIASRLSRLPRRQVLHLEVPVAIGLRVRLLGLSGLGPAEAGAGLLIPRCAGVHTFGMRFDLDLFFLDAEGRPLAVRRAVPPRRLTSYRGAAAVLEIPATPGGESDAPRT